MITIALQIFGYWIGLAITIWLVMLAALGIARTCEFAVDHLFK